MLERLKREDETFDELLERLAQSEQPINIGAWSEEEAENARDAVARSRESFDR
jgi:predicted CopG family antitoxin